MKAVLLLLLGALYGLSHGQNRSNLSNLTFGLFVSRSGSISLEGVLPAIDMALNKINSNDSVLPGYYLNYGTRDQIIDAMVGLVRVRY